MKILTFNKNFDYELAIDLAKLSKEVYDVKETNDSVYSVLKEKFYLDELIVEQFKEKINNTKVDLQFFIIKQNNNIIIVFKGSEEKQDWLSNSKIEPILFSKEDKTVHTGFYSYYKGFLEFISKSSNPICKELLKDKVSYNIFITGHSLGGAIATLLTAYFYERKFANNLVCYTFGAPPVGWEKFHEKYKELPLYRIINQFDPIPKINLLNTGFLSKYISHIKQWKELKHVGIEKELESDEGEIHGINEYIDNLKKDNKKTLKRNKPFNLIKAISKNRWNTFLICLICITITFGIHGFLKIPETKVLDAIYKTFGLFIMDYNIEGKGNIFLEIARFSALFFFASAIIKISLHFFDNNLTKPIRLRKKRDHIIIFGFNNHTKKLVENINKTSPDLQIILVTSDEISPSSLEIKAESIKIPTQFTKKFMKILALEHARHIVCMNMNDNIDINHAHAIIEYLNDYEEVNNYVNLHIHLNSYSLVDLFNHENYLSLQSKTPCNIKVFNQNDNAARLLFRNIAMEEFIKDKTPHWLITGDENQIISFMRYVIQISYYKEEFPIVTLIVKDIENSKKRLNKFFPKLHKTAKINIADSIEFQESITNIAILFENETLGLEEAFTINNIYKEIPIFLLQRKEVLIENSQIVPFGQYTRLNTKEIILNEKLDERAEIIHNYFKDKFGAPTWKELPLFKKNSNRMQAEHTNIKLRALAKDSNDDMITTLARIEHLRWNAFHYIHGWNYSEDKIDSRKVHPCLVPFDELEDKEKEKDISVLKELLEYIEEIEEKDVKDAKKNI